MPFFEVPIEGDVSALDFLARVVCFFDRIDHIFVPESFYGLLGGSYTHYGVHRLCVVGDDVYPGLIVLVTGKPQWFDSEFRDAFCIDG